MTPYSEPDRHSHQGIYNCSRPTVCMKMTTTGLRRYHPVFPKALVDCADVQESGINSSGIYSIHPDGIKEPLKVYCDMTTAGGGWTVFQRRMNGSVDFNANSLYKDGFGSVWGEHWLGNQNVYHLTNQRPCELRIDLYDFKGNTVHATYSHFSISNETMKYELRLGLFSGGGAGKTYSLLFFPFPLPLTILMR
ncbi:angiopoietin-4-like [Lytechinus pictus]|uniref:angiopoietin-4-like n=1 Tax=Lytechinus pictus TaxID=7653 RepID=UPI0030BA0459